VSPGFTSTRVVPVLLMSCGLSGRYDSATILAAQRDDHEQDVDLSHSDDLNSLLAVHEFRVEFFQSVQSSRAAMASTKSTPCLRRFSAALPLSHSYCTSSFVPDIGSGGNNLPPIFGTNWELWRGFTRDPAVTAACSGVQWRATVDEDGQYSFAVAL
jgi:hypothetical protein